MSELKKPPVLATLKEAVKGLLCVSETEAELKPFVWDAAGELKQDRLVALAGAAKGTAVEETSLDAFFRAISTDDKPKFDKLAKVIQRELTGVKVYKMGDEAEKLVYVVGKTEDGRWAGVRTSVVET
jgi:hypothetical protein